MRGWRALPVVLLAAGCAGGDRSCQSALANASSQAVEQFYVARAGQGWGRDLLPDRELPPGATLPFRFPAEGSHAVRAVWANGRAVEMQGIEACRTARITLRDGALQAE